MLTFNQFIMESMQSCKGEITISGTKGSHLSVQIVITDNKSLDGFTFTVTDKAKKELASGFIEKAKPGNYSGDFSIYKSGTYSDIKYRCEISLISGNTFEAYSGTTKVAECNYQ